MRYRRILLKMSGESLKGDRDSGIEPENLTHYANEVKQITDAGAQVAVVVGRGNIVHAASAGRSQSSGRPE